MSAAPAGRVVKEILIDVGKCTGCRACEMACSAFHARPRYGSVNPARSRIRVVTDEINDEYVPVRAGNLSRAECEGRHFYRVEGKRYSECSFCRAACPSRDFFIEPDSGLPLKCDMCEDEPPLAEPLCVTVCGADCLVYRERPIEPGQDALTADEAAERGVLALVSRHGLTAVIEALDRVARRP